MRRSAARAAILGLLLASPGGHALARVYLTQRQALEHAFPAPHRVDRRTLYLSAGQLTRASKAAGEPIEDGVIPYYVGLLEGRATGFAYFDTHLVRTLPETILVLLGPDGRIVRIDILSFDEPEDYLPSPRWLEQFPGRSAVDDLSLDRGIRALTGATLSARAITAAARRVVALHRLFVAPDLLPEGSPETHGRDLP